MKTIKQALSLPTICNLNPRSIYNKVEEFQTFVNEEEIDVVFLSESWERDNLSLNEIIKLEDYEVVSNVSQRKGIGGRPAIIANCKKYDIIDLTNNLVQIPWGVEAVWCILSPKNVTPDSKIKAIACCSFYYRQKTRKKSLLLSHFSDAFHIISKKYSKGLEFIIAGDANDLKLNALLNLNPRFCQIVKDFTRMNPPALLDPIVTSLSNYYQRPECIEPLQADSQKLGTASDHRIVIARPISEINNKSGREYREIKVRPLMQSGINQLQLWLIDQSWDQVYQAKSAHQKAEIFQSTLMSALDKFLPVKTKRFCDNDQPWMTQKLKDLDRKRKRIYRKERRSDKWKSLNKKFKKDVKLAKSKYYKNTVENLKLKKPGQWYAALKRISQESESFQINCEEINHLSNEEQVEKIAERFAMIPNSYEALKSEDIEIPHFSPEDVPQFPVSKVWKLLTKTKTNKAVIDGDFPPKLIKLFAAYLAEPLTDIINSALLRGEYPNLYKKEVCTPVPKKYPPKETSDLRNISGLLTFDKVLQTLLAELMMEDMKTNLDPSQYGNKKGVSIQHYLLCMIHRILSSVDDQNKPKAVIASLIDWNSAFRRQCPRLGVKSFIKNGVRPSLIPLLINFFQDRQMYVKWHGCKSVPRELNGGGPEGATLGLLEYISQSNDCADVVNVNDRFRFLDDLSILEIINLLLVGLSEYDITSHVPNDVPNHNQYIAPEKLKTQQWLHEINELTKEKKMLINEKKTKVMIFNFTNTHQFSTRLCLENEILEEVKSTKLLDTIITNDLKWDKNTEFIVQKANARMELLRKLSNFNVSIEDLKNIYVLFVRSQLEQSAVVWHSALTEENKSDLERVQRSALKIILGKKYMSYEKSLNYLGLETLEERRESLCLKFALKCLENENTSEIFDYNEKIHQMSLRKTDILKIDHSNTKRLKDCGIRYMQRLLNNYFQN